jgi:uncharacterized damage-inducible protein DinB
VGTHYQIDDQALMTDLLSGTGAFLGPEAVLEGLNAEQAFTKPHGLPHSIAEIVAHMCFWQEWFNECARAGFTGVPLHAAEGWPAVEPASGATGWTEVRERFFAAMADAKQIIAESRGFAEPLLPAGVEIPVLARETRGSGILHGAVHSGHHLGQIITIRQLLGAWPPPAGSMTW